MENTPTEIVLEIIERLDVWNGSCAGLVSRGWSELRKWKRDPVFLPHFAISRPSPHDTTRFEGQQAGLRAIDYTVSQARNGKPTILVLEDVSIIDIVVRADVKKLFCNKFDCCCDKPIHVLNYHTHGMYDNTEGIETIFGYDNSTVYATAVTTTTVKGSISKDLQGRIAHVAAKLQPGHPVLFLVKELPGKACNKHVFVVRQKSDVEKWNARTHPIVVAKSGMAQLPYFWERFSEVITDGCRLLRYTETQHTTWHHFEHEQLVSAAVSTVAQTRHVDL